MKIGFIQDQKGRLQGQGAQDGDNLLIAIGK